ncbi:hypothetical protein S40288_09476 [Stachybotrys chartarum IBT 40288]|nr:hypothetical protein S40288_09476 [Stachybotrys chartarum IBT 40288]
MQHGANLARIRDNQRRSRARRREYLQELEQRLRLCELQGIEASAEVQLAARRVAGENKQLRELLNKCGIGDEHIEQYIQARITPFAENAPTQSCSTSNSGPAVQTLQHLMSPRNPPCLDSTAVIQVPSPISSVGSSTLSGTLNGTISIPSHWEPSQPSQPPPYSYSYSYGQQPQQFGHMPTVPATQPMQPPYLLVLAPGSTTPRSGHRKLSFESSKGIRSPVEYEYHFLSTNHDPTVGHRGTMDNYATKKQSSPPRKSTPADARRQLGGSYARPFEWFNSIVAGQSCCSRSTAEGAVKQNGSENVNWPFLRSDSSSASSSVSESREANEKPKPEAITFGTSARASIHKVDAEDFEDGLVEAAEEEWPDDTSLDSTLDWINDVYKDPRVPGAYPSSIAEEDEHQTFLTMAGLRALVQIFRADLSFTNNEEREAMLGIVRRWPSELQGNDESKARELAVVKATLQVVAAWLDGVTVDDAIDVRLG